MSTITTQEVIDLYGKHVITNYGRLPIAIVRGQGNWIWDADGRKYLDFFPGWAVSGLGHCHPKVVQRLKEQADILLHVDNTFLNVPQAQLAKMLSERSFGGKQFFCNSGAEASEAAIKLARIKGNGERYKIITMEKSFHGRTFGAMTATGQAKIHKGFQPLVPGFTYVPFNDFDALADAVDDQTIGVMFEPVQGEGGVNPAKPDYVKRVRELCDERGLVLIFDEVQTGMGRTGKWFGYQHYDITPDIVTLAKALGGGVSIGAIMAKKELADLMKPGMHGSTFGGNPLACMAAIGVIEAIEEGNLLKHTNEIAAYIGRKLEELATKFELIAEIRQLGLMIGIELTVDGAEITSSALKEGLRINCTQGNVLRMVPAMTVTTEEVDHAMTILERVLTDYQNKLATEQTNG